MKILRILFLIMLVAGSAQAARRGRGGGYPARLGMGMRFHRAEHTTIERWPYDDGDISYGLYYALYEGMGYLEVGLDYTPGKLELPDDKVDMVLTPRLNMAIIDGIFVAGVGIADSYIKFDHGKNEWSGLLYQLHLGLEIPLGSNFSVDGGAYYSFKRWGDLSDFETSDLEYAIRLGYRF